MVKNKVDSNDTYMVLCKNTHKFPHIIIEEPLTFRFLFRVGFRNGALSGKNWFYLHHSAKYYKKCLIWLRIVGEFCIFAI